jgi:hypothetical protein
MGPNHDLGSLTLSFDMRHEHVKRLRHVPIAPVPGRHSISKHVSVIRFRIPDHIGLCAA